MAARRRTFMKGRRVKPAPQPTERPAGRAPARAPPDEEEIIVRD